jgi:signal transduction histidine kinase
VRLGARLFWLRCVAIVGAAAAVALASRLTGSVAPEDTAALWAGVAALVALDVVVAAGGRRGFPPLGLTAQIAADVAILGWMVHHAGGLRNPFSGFFVFHAALAAIVLEPRAGRRVTLVIALFVFALGAAEASALVPAGCLAAAPAGCLGRGDVLLEAASTLAVGALVLGCTLFVVPLVGALHAERAHLAHANAALSGQGAHLAAARSETQREKRQLQTIVDCIADAVLYVEQDGAVRLHNRAALRLFPSGAAPTDGVRACHTADNWREITGRLLDPKPFELHPVLDVGGRLYEASYSRVFDEDGTLRGVVMVARDVTERIREQHVRMNEERMVVVGKLAAGLAHELNNPLGAIALFAQHALAGTRKEDPLADYLATVLRNANLCKKIVRDLLEYARQRAPEKSDVVLSDLLGDVVRTLRPQAQSMGVRVATDLGEAGASTLFGDADQLRQVLVNLGLNAIEAMPDGGELSFRLRVGDGAVRIEVSDSGPGIAEDDRERIFAAFHTTKSEGTGLGLTIARDLVAAHGGTLAVVSEPQRGSTFTVEIPVPGRSSGPEEEPAR